MTDKRFKIAFPSPFSLVIGLTLFCFVLVLMRKEPQGMGIQEKLISALNFWQFGFFGLLGFTVQMMMILVFGYALASCKPVHDFLKKVANFPKNGVQALMFTGIVTMFSGLLNWGFGLIIGALMARFVGRAQKEKGNQPNYALLASAGYLGMAVWHGGLSGSAPLKVAESGHFLKDQIGIIPIEETILENFNLGMTGGLIGVLLAGLLFCEKYVKQSEQTIKPISLNAINPGKSFQLCGLVGLGILLILTINYFSESVPDNSSVNLNVVNFALFGLTMAVYKSFSKFSKAVSAGLKTSVDIFIQFPFYAGILGLMTQSGLLIQFSDLLVSYSNQRTLPLISYVSAGIVNFLVPSGGGQWAVQGPVLLTAGKSLGIPLNRLVMAFSYGDQITNLLQPFWALPLLSITGVRAKNMLKYCFVLCVFGSLFLALAIYFFL
ncbi:short-chain fatty acid transporter [Algoriphagus aestuarii]|nr:short-chain fatty acid transporter [Algoriphagus aestuarii]